MINMLTKIYVSNNFDNVISLSIATRQWAVNNERLSRIIILLFWGNFFKPTVNLLPWKRRGIWKYVTVVQSAARSSKNYDNTLLI